MTTLSSPRSGHVCKPGSRISFLLFLILGPLSTSFAQIATLYPGDSAIQSDSRVIFSDMFEQSSVSAMLTSSGYQLTGLISHVNFDTQVPTGSPGRQSLKLTTVENSSAPNDSSEEASLLKKFTPGINDSVFVRFYVKFNSSHTFHHSGVWLGGTNPSLPCWPCYYPGRTIPPGGDSAFVIGTEIRGAANISAQTASPLGFYNYWMGMKPYTSGPNAGKYFGNEFIAPNTASVIQMDAWNCIEVMLKMNNPTSDSTGEIKLWINGQLISGYGKGFPNGTWNQAFFNEGAGNPFEGFRWRNNAGVVFNYIWLKNYSTGNTAYPSANDMLFDHLVVARSYIGPIYTVPEYTIEANAGTHGTINPSGTVKVLKGNNRPFSIHPDKGYHVDSLLVDGTPVTPDTVYTFTNVQGNHTLRVVFAINMYTISAGSGANGNILPYGSVNVAYGTTQMFYIRPVTGYHVDSLLADEIPVTPDTVYAFTNVQANHTIRVVFAANTQYFTIQSSAASNGSISPSGAVTLAAGDTQKFSIIPAPGYHTDSLLVDGVPVTADTVYTFSNVQANHSIRAVFAINRYTITATAGTGGSIQPAGVIQVKHGDSITFSITPNAAYHTDTVWADGISSGPISSFTFRNVVAPHVLHATFKPDPSGISSLHTPQTVIYPNPTNGIIYISGANPAAVFSLTDTQGKNIPIELLPAETGGLLFCNVQHLQAGVYLLFESTRNGRVCFKLCIQR